MNENELQVFANEEFGDVRTIMINDKPYFCASDVAKALGYKRPNDAVSQHCRATVKHSTHISGKMQEINFIPEGDIYRLVMRSKLPSAEKFESWVVEEVLPQIRKHGAYMTENTIEKALTDPDFLIQLATQLKEEREQKKKLEVMNAAKDQVIGELQPKADYTDEILKCPGTVTINQIAKDYGMSGTKMNKILNELGVQFKKSGQWFIYEKYNCKGYTNRQVVQIERNGCKDWVMKTKWTQKGRLFLYELLKNEGIYPNIEKGEK
ncbi:MAG: phage antirepressor [Erysipelotrichaceae bacterium]|nr:phage antirepressor [Erysipelotrichaceae bacterium]